jgi:hypothetical protein
MKREASHEGKVEWVYQFIRQNSNWIPADADNDYDREVIESLIAMMTVQHISNWKVVRATESGEPFLYSGKPVFTSGLPTLKLRKKYGV